MINGLPVFDFHTHPYIPDGLSPAIRALHADSPVVREFGDKLRDGAFVADLFREHGIEGAVALAENCPETSGVVTNAEVLAWCTTDPAFWVPFASIHPGLEADPVSSLKSAIDGGARGLKLYPSYQFVAPDDARAMALYPLLIEHQLPFLAHVGSSTVPGTVLEYCHPRHFEVVANEFPELTVVLAHAGRGHWYSECADLAVNRPNVYLDLTGLVPKQVPQLIPRLNELQDKIIFGSDWPAMPKTPWQNVQSYLDIGEWKNGGEELMGGTARRLLSLHR